MADARSRAEWERERGGVAAGGPRARPPTIVFDLGGVLIDWDPRHLYRRMFDDTDRMERFLAEVATSDWNRAQDAGRPFAEGVALLAAAHPEAREWIEAYHLRWAEMLGDPIETAVAVLAELRAAGARLYVLSNWSAETFPLARARYPFLDWFDGILISGEVGLTKPDARVFRLLAERFGLEPHETVFIDDQAANVEAAERLGFMAIRFEGGEQLRRALEALGALDRVA